MSGRHILSVALLSLAGVVALLVIRGTAQVNDSVDSARLAAYKAELARLEQEIVAAYGRNDINSARAAEFKAKTLSEALAQALPQQSGSKNALDGPATSTEIQSFDAKVTLVEGQHFTPAILENVSTQRIGDRWFLVGTTPTKDLALRNDFRGKSHWVSVNDIERIVVFESVDEVNTAMNYQSTN